MALWKYNQQFLLVSAKGSNLQGWRWRQDWREGQVGLSTASSVKEGKATKYLFVL